MLSITFIVKQVLRNSLNNDIVSITELLFCIVLEAKFKST